MTGVQTCALPISAEGPATEADHVFMPEMRICDKVDHCFASPQKKSVFFFIRKDDPIPCFRNTIIVENFCPLRYNTSQKHTKAVQEISENEIAKILVLIPCLVACFPLHRNHYLDDGL